MNFTQKTEKPEIKVEKKGHKKIYLSAGVILILSLLSAYGIYAFFTTYALQSPILFQAPIRKLNPDVIISPVSSESGKAAKTGTFNVGEIADKIYILESSGGKNDGCRELGKFNGYGYRQNSFEWVCYDSHEEVRQLVINWLTKHIKDGNIEQALCLYNQGKITSECTYALNYKSL